MRSATVHAGWHLVGDDDLAASHDGLAAAWSSDRSVVLAPTRRGVNPAWFRDALDRLPAALAHDHVALLTSGSTGTPRLVVGTKSRARAMASCIHVHQDNHAVARTVTLLPLTYSYAFVNQWVWAHAHDRTLVVSPGLADVSATRALLRDGPDTMVCLVGPLFSLLARHVPDGEPLTSVTRVNFAGAPFPWPERAALARVFPRARVFNNYGCTEAMPRLTITAMDALTGPSDLGVPLPGVELGIDAAGELRFRSAYGAVGLVEDGAYREVAADQWLGTQDVAVAHDDGRFALLGRRSEVYKRHGEKVSVAQQLEAVRAVWVGQAAAMMERDPAGDPAHVVVLAPTPSADQLRAVLKVFRARFPRAHWPLRVDCVDTMPLLETNKPDLQALAATVRRVCWQLPR